MVCRASPSRQRSLLSASEAQGVVRISCWSHNEIGPVEDSCLETNVQLQQRQVERPVIKNRIRNTLFVLSTLYSPYDHSVSIIFIQHANLPSSTSPKMLRRSFLVMARDTHLKIPLP